MKNEGKRGLENLQALDPNLQFGKPMPLGQDSKSMNGNSKIGNDEMDLAGSKEKRNSFQSSGKEMKNNFMSFDDK